MSFNLSSPNTLASPTVLATTRRGAKGIDSGAKPALEIGSGDHYNTADTKDKAPAAAAAGAPMLFMEDLATARMSAVGLYKLNSVDLVLESAWFQPLRL